MNIYRNVRIPRFHDESVAKGFEQSRSEKLRNDSMAQRLSMNEQAMANENVMRGLGQQASEASNKERPAIFMQMSTLDPKAAKNYADFYSSLDDKERSQIDAMNDDMMKFSYQIMQYAPEKRSEAYGRLRNKLNPMIQESLPPQYNEGAVRSLQLAGADGDALSEYVLETQKQEGRRELTKLKGEEDRKTQQLKNKWIMREKKEKPIKDTELIKAVKEFYPDFDFDQEGGLAKAADVRRLMNTGEMGLIEAIEEVMGGGGTVDFSTWSN